MLLKLFVSLSILNHLGAQYLVDRLFSGDTGHSESVRRSDISASDVKTEAPFQCLRGSYSEKN